jgi:hypothetical protein
LLATVVVKLAAHFNKGIAAGDDVEEISFRICRERGLQVSSMILRRVKEDEQYLTDCQAISRKFMKEPSNRKLNLKIAMH